MTHAVATIEHERLGWTRAGQIPRYAATPDASLAPTIVFYKELT
jgi:hypothetical protein